MQPKLSNRRKIKSRYVIVGVIVIVLIYIVVSIVNYVDSRKSKFDKLKEIKENHIIVYDRDRHELVPYDKEMEVEINDQEYADSMYYTESDFDGLS